MDTIGAITTRRSTRRFVEREVEEEKLNQILDAVRMSPSWANRQCWRFVIVRDAETRRKISDLSNVESYFAPLGYKANPAMKGIAEAPVVVIACADPRQSGILRGQHYYMTDLGIASQTLMLAAHELGLASVFVGVFDEEGLKELLGVPAMIRIVGIIPLGYPLKDKTDAPPRRPLSELVFYEKWS